MASCSSSVSRFRSAPLPGSCHVTGSHPSNVRQTASRQLEFLLRQQRCKDPAFVVPAEPFFEQLRQPHVLERQKAGALLFELARTDREVARRLREEV